MRNWADEVQRLTPAERASTTAFSPFIPDPESGRLFLLNEIVKGQPQHGSGFPVEQAPGWREVSPGVLVWCALGAKGVIAGDELPRRVVSPMAGTINVNHHVILDVIARGHGFLFCGDLFLLPNEPFNMNSFTYELSPEPLTVFTGFRGHRSATIKC